jgi:capsular polysaccharide export protein
MRSFGHTTNPFRRRPAVPAAVMARLFPEVADGSLRLAEGLLRAPRRGRASPPCLSVLVRDAAVAGTPNRILADRGWETPALLRRAAAARRALVAARVGGSWWHGGAGELPAGGGHAVVALLDGDCATTPADAVVRAMLDRAFAAHPSGPLVVLAPGASGRRFGASLAAAAARGAAVIDRPLDPWLVLDRAARVYSAGGEIGFLALLAEVPVAAFGSAFYTGWGVTEDAPGTPQHGLRRTVDEIFAGACLLATRYRDPFRDVATNFEEALSIVAEWRRLDDANRRIAACVGMSFWKRRRIVEFLRSSAGVPVFCRTASDALAVARRGPGAPRAVAGWASRLPQGFADPAARDGVPLIRVEDGFIRSVGLGSDFLPPASLVCDSRGMYFDPRVRSDLETLLSETAFPPALIARARHLAAALVARGITKYNLTGSGASLDLPPGRRRILVPGQVEDDLSLRFGGSEVCTNLGLLAAARGANPEAFILYKPHPDVAAGHRKGAIPEAAARNFADLVVRDASTAALLALVDELHTMTSLAGFEALLRGKRVVVYGRPFYAGWGLTDDKVSVARRRRLMLDELVAGALILYPRYLDPLTRLPCGPEVIIERLDHPELWRAGPLVLGRRLQGAVVRHLRDARAALSFAGLAPLRELSGRPRP